ncbi:NusA N-terminal domain-containing protein [Mycoplasma leonicaptivi]|uniref:NusA N-terminal domain-containing protein n=1 Tax=Mycoplasma leonicaptivi TaxID=36742 RepID=UPI00055F2EC2|nr:NusA N-terminal domain-containing protein [Mycoplasma leonicaptivi]
MSNQKNKNTNINSLFYATLKTYAEIEKISFIEVVEIFKNEVEKVITKTFDPDAEISVEYDHKLQEAWFINQNGQVVEDGSIEVSDVEEKSPIVEKISFIEENSAKLIDSKVKVGDNFVIKFTFDNLPLKTKKTIEQCLRQEIKNARKNRILEIFKDKIGLKFNAKVNHTVGRKGFSLEIIDGVDTFKAFLPKNKINRSINLQPGLNVEVILENVNAEENTSLEVSMIQPIQVEKTLQNEISEIENGDIEIVKIQRIAGVRTKVSVRPNPERNFDFDIISSMFGEEGSRISSVSEKLGEKVEIIRYSDDLREYISNALSPVKPVDVLVKKDLQSAYVVIKDEDIKRAFGIKKTNLDCASKLVGIKLELITVSNAIKSNLPFKREKLKKEFKEIDKPLFKEKQSFKRSKFNSYLSSQELDMSNLDFDIQSAFAELENDIEAERTRLEQERLDNKNKKEKSSVSKISNRIQKDEMDDLFDKINNDYDDSLVIEGNFDFINEINSEIEAEFIAEDELDEYEISNETETEIKKPSKSKNSNKIVSEYKKIKDFKMDNDLANYGLDQNLDLGDIKDEDWN